MALANPSLVHSFPSCSTPAACCSHNDAISSRVQSLSLCAISNLPTARKLISSSRCHSSVQRKRESVSFCTNPEAVDAVEVSALLAASRQNCQQFPSLLNDGAIVPVDPVKLRCAMRHSTVVVALYVQGREEGGEELIETRPPQQLEVRLSRSWLDYWMPRPRTGPKTLVAFGRATSDRTLTASIYDLVVAPSYQISGYGSQVLLRIVRDLRRLGICDIAVTPSPELRPFFEHCGFGPDILKSVTMMYTRTSSSSTKSLQIKEYGKKALLIPPPLTVFQGKGSHHVR